MRNCRRFQMWGLACLIGFSALCASVPAMAAWTKTGGSYTDSSGAAISGVTARGIDLSYGQQSINWNAVAADDIQFVMLSTRYNNDVDPYFGRNATAAFQAGLDVGAYIYSYATSTEMAEKEASFVLNLIKDYPISYPVVFDVEASAMGALSSSELSKVINAFCGSVKNAGYYPMVYAKDDWLNSKIDMNQIPYDVWVSRYDNRPSYTGAAMWQATGSGSVSGISGNVDLNFAYKDFSERIPSKQWRNIDGKWYYYINHTLQKGWINDGNGWYYMSSDGTPAKGWIQVDGKYFHLDSNTGKMNLGWYQDPANSTWYYLSSDGSMATGWQLLDGRYYYLDSSGAMRTGWLQLEDGWYYLSPEGKMRVGWQEIGGSWYYLGESGRMTTGWQQIKGNWFYLASDGKMATGWQKIGQETYYLYTDGHMLTGWLTDSAGNKYYMSPNSGRMIRGWRLIDSSWYYFDASGYMMKGWIKLDGHYYYLDPGSGKMAANSSVVIDQVTYTFDKSGVCQNDANSMGNVSAVSPGTYQPTGSSSGGSAGSSTPGSSSSGSGPSSPGGDSGNGSSSSDHPSSDGPVFPGSSSHGSGETYELEEGLTTGPR